MLDSTPRLVAGIVAACVVLSVLVIWRSRQHEPVPAPVPGSFGPRGTARPDAARAGDFGGGSLATRPDAPADANPVRLGEAGEHTVPSREGRRLALEPLPPADPSRRGGVLAEAGGFPFAEFPEGTRLAASLRNSSTTTDQTGPAVDENIYYDGDEGAYFPPDAQLAYPDRGGVETGQGTVSFWVQPGFKGSDPTDNSFVQLRVPDSWSNRLQVFKNGVFLRFLFTDNTGIENNVGVGIDQWEPGQWHHVTATWGESVTSLYVDGMLVGQGQYGGALEVPPGTPLFVGSDFRGATPGANAVLRGFLVFGRPLDPGEVRRLYHFGP